MSSPIVFTSSFRQVFAAILLLLSLAFGLAQAQDGDAAEDDAPATPRQWAILIGAEKYRNERIGKLRYTANDVRQLAGTLQTRGGFDRDRILEISDDREEALRPTKQAVSDQLTEWLKKPGPDDTLLVYFSGHGERDAAGRLYLLPVDCDPSDLPATGISIEWFRGQIASCRAKFKLLVLDACHAGNEKSPAAGAGVAAAELGASFKNVEHVVTLASCGADENSLLWDEKKQSLFSFWLNQGLKGHADADADGAVDVGELYDFVHDSVKHTAEMRLGRPTQTPRQIIHAAIDGVPEVLRLRPQPLKTVLADMAEQLAYALDERRLRAVGVLKFIEVSGAEQLLGRDYGELGEYCCDYIERELLRRAEGKFSVVERRKLREIMREAKQPFTLASLGSDAQLRSLSEAADGMPVVIVGTFKAPVYRDGGDCSLVRLSCELVQTQAKVKLGVTVHGTAALNVNEWAMRGRSVVVRAEDQRPAWALPGVDAAGQAAVTIERLENHAAGPKSHPFSDPTFEFNVELVIDGTVRKGKFRDNDYFVPVTKGEEYQIRVESRRGKPAMMRLLVDGLNTLPEKEKDTEKGVVIQPWGSHVSLNEARAWVLDPADPRLPGGKPFWTIQGFVTATGAKGEQRQFTVVDAGESLAASQHFEADIGLITAAFYVAVSSKASDRGGPSGLGTAAGHEVNTDLTEREGLKLGNPLGIAHIRYVSWEAFKRVK